MKRAYSPVQDASIIFEIKTKLTLSNKAPYLWLVIIMNGYWIKLDHYQDIEMLRGEDATIPNTMLERDRIAEFLAGLNPEYDQVKMQILGKKKLPLLNEVFF